MTTEKSLPEPGDDKYRLEEIRQKLLKEPMDMEEFYRELQKEVKK